MAERKGYLHSSAFDLLVPHIFNNQMANSSNQVKGTVAGGLSPVLKKHRSDKVSQVITNTFGSVTFLFSCVLLIGLWICWNLNFFPGLKPFDHYPFPALEMGVSIFAIILSISVLISQKRQTRLEKVHQQVEFEINVRAEEEITKMLDMLHDIQKKLGIANKDAELELMKRKTDIEQLHRDAEE